MSATRSRRALGLSLAAVLVALAAVSAAAVSRGGAARDDGPRVTGVSVRAVSRSFTDEDAGGATLQLDREVRIEGRGFFGTSFGPFVRFVTDDGARLEAVMVVLESGSRIVAFPPPGTRGRLRLEVENPDGRAATGTVDL
jgi:hypothetical protein